MYCGTATSGAYKSTNKGLNWELVTREMPITQIYSIVIDGMMRIWFGLVKVVENCIKLRMVVIHGQFVDRDAYQSSDRWYRTLMQTDLGLLLLQMMAFGSALTMQKQCN